VNARKFFKDCLNYNNNKIVRHRNICYNSYLYGCHVCFFAGKIGITLNVGWSEPFDKYNPDDLDTSNRDINFNLGWFAHAIYVNGDYPEVMKRNVHEKSIKQGYKKSRLPEFTFQEKIFINGNVYILRSRYTFIPLKQM
jgi:lactase-phlorizin hydrolase